MRHYDPTIGRWLSTDPYDEFASPYVGMGADPVNNVDPDGGSIWGTIGSALGTAGKIIKNLFSGGSKGVALVGRFSLSGSSASSSGSVSSFAGDLANGAGNSIAGVAGEWVANKLFPLPSGPDAGQLQQATKQIPLRAGSSSNFNPITFTYTKDKNGKITAEVTINMSILDPIGRYGEAGKIQIENLIPSLGGTIHVGSADEKGNPVDIVAEIKVKANVKMVMNIDQVRSGDYVIGIVNSIPGNPIGMADDIPGSVGAVESLSYTSITTVIFHELGHILGLEHEAETFMNPTVDFIDPKGQYRNVTNGQKKTIWTWIVQKIFGATRTWVPTIPDIKVKYKEFIQEQSIK